MTWRRPSKQAAGAWTPANLQHKPLRYIVRGTVGVGVPTIIVNLCAYLPREGQLQGPGSTAAPTLVVCWQKKIC
jgi:hypothetical protein